MAKRNGEFESMNVRAGQWQKPLDLAFLEKKPGVQGRRIFAAVAFGDITRFQRWTNHPFLSAEKHTQFMVQLYDEFIRFRNGSGYFVKLLCDGLMAVQELPDEKKKASLTTKMLDHSQNLVGAVESLIKRLRYPRPDGFRVRVVAGDILKLEAIHPTDKRKKQIDYAEYPVSLAHSLLEVEKDIPCICHESIREIIADDRLSKSLVDFLPVQEPAFCPEGINPDDLKSLWAFRIK
ncbi:MAG: hypothetical protein KCHDKBKB_01001 [Elusimicrobia bacterium]|nr:hypothetical protein [Elusimicrobiota bacterium]